MPAAPLARKGDISKLAIIAGGGNLPRTLIENCDRKGIEVFVVGFEGQTDPALIEGRNHIWTRLGAPAGQIFKALESHGIQDLVMIGSIRRPSIVELRPDLKAAEFFAKSGLKILGDDGLLGALRKFLEEHGLRIHGVHEFTPDLLMPEGLVGVCEPGKVDWEDIERGWDVSQLLGLADVGQSVVVQEGIVLGVEATEGTDALIRRIKPLKRSGSGGVLVKTAKPQQDLSFDMPIIGPETVLVAAESGLSGLAVHAGRALLVNPQEVAQIADRNKMFVIGIDLSEKEI